MKIEELYEKKTFSFRKMFRMRKKARNKIKDESYGVTGGASNPPLSRHLTPTRDGIFGRWV